MATESVLALCQDAADIIGVEVPQTIINAHGDYGATFRVVANHAGLKLMRRRGAFAESWAGLNKDFTLTTVANQARYPLPPDFVALLTETVWDQGSRYPAVGPQSPTDWYLYQYGIGTPTTLSYRYRIVSSAFDRKALQLDPVPTSADDQLAFQYLSDSWLRTDEAEYPDHKKIASDTDIPIYPADLFTLDIIWRFKKSQGLPFQTELGEFEDLLSDVLGDEYPYTRLVMGGGSGTRDNRPSNIWANIQIDV